MKYSPEERSVLKNLFDSFDAEETGQLHLNQLPSFLARIGKEGAAVVALIEQFSAIAEETGGAIDFETLISNLEDFENRSAAEDGTGGLDGPDKKVLEFLRILEEYRIKCEEEGNYLEAARADKQLEILKKQEEKRQQKSVLDRHIAERQDVQSAHSMQFQEFCESWDRYMEEYDRMAQMYIQQMIERHAVILLDYQKSLRDELASKPPKWSKELLDWRRRQHTMARSKHYAEAQKIRKVADQAEEKERRDIEQAQAVVFAKKEAKFRQQQQSELQALLKRIETRRKEHVKQREADTKRLLQRNRNVQAVLESKQAADMQKTFTDIKKQLLHCTFISHHKGGDAGSTGGGSLKGADASGARLPTVH